MSDSVRTVSADILAPGYDVRVTGLAVARNGSPTLGSESSLVTIQDEGGGEFIEIEQPGVGKIRVDPEEWPVVKGAIDRLVAVCR